jgi:hypothetical protein
MAYILLFSGAMLQIRTRWRKNRRRKRSKNLTISLNLWLASLASRLRIPGLILLDLSGLVIASNFRGPKTDELAALVPLLARPNEEGVRLIDRRRVPLSIQPMEHRGETLFVCAVGERIRRENGARIAAIGVRRILKEHHLEI